MHLLEASDNAVGRAEGGFIGLVIWQPNPPFSTGADLKAIRAFVRKKRLRRGRTHGPTRRPRSPIASWRRSWLFDDWAAIFRHFYELRHLEGVVAKTRAKKKLIRVVGASRVPPSCALTVRASC
jgi:hypothetical protein